ncbi:CDP-glycerol glycerophosphotransferase family protein [Weizmannia acidilactici]|uniref:CDP-glycerol glycerophosphotransferase family protein n=1 Tax=Weizmannia acidilactici TaxID=2607726 RepID=UPI00124CECDD|nr:CDP-glycerol glycerophosphotransferase family protein [Weizmannia acidilactici]GER67122.1 ribitolphosphotransferase [Weizmannia acidilactici]GER74761.1 ribitolphosphotransferase [Weizmannia acidilactici]
MGLRRIAGKIRNKLFSRQPDSSQADMSQWEDEIELLENLSPVIPNIEEQRYLTAKRKVAGLYWNGPIMRIRGYFYLENIPLHDEDLVRKRLVLIDGKNNKIYIPLSDVYIGEIDGSLPDDVKEQYYWAGFKGEVNFSTITSKNMPLPESVYKTYIDIDAHVSGVKRYVKRYPLGNIEHFLDQKFYTAKMEYFSARKELKYNLLATYDKAEKTLKIESTKLKDLDPSEYNLEKMKKGSIFYRFMRSVGFRTLYKIFKLLPLKEKKILFASDSREDLSGNFKFVFDEMVRRGLEFDYHFMLKKGIAAEKSYKDIVKLAYHLATSKFILLDDFYPMVYPLKIRKNAELVQLWHAVGAFKTFGFSRLGRPGGPSPKSKNHRNYTKAIVSSHNIAKHYAEGFGIDIEKVIPTGIPRTDVFFDKAYQEQVKTSLYEEYPFLKDKKVIMFAPTFRGNGQQSAHFPMEVLNLDKLYHELKDEYVFLFKIHPFVKNDFSIPYQYSDFFYDFSSYREINDLLFVTDILITDYSSVCFEFALLNKPMLFFAFDVEEYVRKRDFYYDYKSFIPGPLIRNTDEMIETIKKEQFDIHKIKPFVQYFFDDTDGKSSARVVDQIILKENWEE